MAEVTGKINNVYDIETEIERPERAVFLGFNPLTGIARESALKVLKLTAGQIVTSWDSTLGFRHGSTPIVNNAGSDTTNAPQFFLLAERLSVAWSKSLGLNVDDPFAGQGNLTRVVANVRLYN